MLIPPSQYLCLNLFSSEFESFYDTIEVYVYKSNSSSKNKLRFKMSLINFNTDNDSLFNAKFLYPVIDSTAKLVGGDSIFIDVNFSHLINGKRIDRKYKDILTKNKI
jgi:hypothetical protein